MSEVSPYEPCNQGADDNVVCDYDRCMGRSDPSDISAVCIQLAVGLPILAVGVSVAVAIVRGMSLLLGIELW